VHGPAAPTVPASWRRYPTEGERRGGPAGGLKGFRRNARYYTEQEDRRIIEYLLKWGLEGQVKGRKVWVWMARDSAMGRSWQSLKERFLKSVLHRLEGFDWLEDGLARRIREAVGRKKHETVVKRSG
jgi:hypothetical protein